jgi:hypothetical protein
MLHELGKDVMALMHGSPLRQMAPQSCALLRLTIEIETSLKSLFFLPVQNVSLNPKSNVGTAVITLIKPTAQQHHVGGCLPSTRCAFMPHRF